MRNADDEFADFQATDDIALRILDRLAMLLRQHDGEFIHVLVEQIDELHEDAGAALGIGGRPCRLSGLGVFDCRANFGNACERDLGLYFAGCRIEDVGGATAGSGDMLAADEMTDFLHGFLLVSVTARMSLEIAQFNAIVYATVVQISTLEGSARGLG
ncbi:hypothetical protein D3C80_831220 [compost metagenome]